MADDSTKSRFRLQDLPDGDLSLNVDFSDGPTLGRSFALYYNQTKLGRLEISPSYPYSTQSPKVYTSIEIDWARFIGFDELTDFLNAIVIHVASGRDPQNNEGSAAWRNIHYALTKTLWDNYRVSQYDQPDDTDWGELNLRFQGTATFYIQRKDAPARRSA